MSPMSHSVLLLSLFLAPAVAVFYFNDDRSVEVPRPGKRNWYHHSGSQYPRTGRAIPPSDITSGGILFPLGSEIPDLDKVLRGIPLEEDTEFPRKDDDDVGEPLSVTGYDTGSDVSESDVGDDENVNVGVALTIMFHMFDTNGDQSLSPQEFSDGMRTYRQENPFC